jgi:hypothetical protein
MSWIDALIFDKEPAKKKPVRAAPAVLNGVCQGCGATNIFWTSNGAGHVLTEVSETGGKRHYCTSVNDFDVIK